jgi:23S rRNA pseudouridine1911/1915/1917 synthase
MEHEEDLLPEEGSSEVLFEKKVFVIDKGQEPFRLDKYVQMHLEGASRSKVQNAIADGLVTVNGEVEKNNYKIRPGDEIVVIQYTNPEYTTLKLEPLPLNIVYEDAHVLVLNKPANQVVHPGVGNFSGTLLNGIAYHLVNQDNTITEETLPRFGMVHRIDKNTTGLLVIAKNQAAASHLAKQFFNHTVHRRYVALVWGDVEQDEGTITGHIARHERFRKMFDVYPDGDQGKHAVTHYKVLQRFQYVTLVECRLETGRTHQIRVHMKHIGHTLFNDWEYGGDKILKGTIYTKYKQFVDNCFEICNRCALHAQQLGFIHPVTGQQMLFETPLPTDMQQVIEKWQRYVGGKLGPQEIS